MRLTHPQCPRTGVLQARLSHLGHDPTWGQRCQRDLVGSGVRRSAASGEEGKRAVSRARINEGDICVGRQIVDGRMKEGRFEKCLLHCRRWERLAKADISPRVYIHKETFRRSHTECRGVAGERRVCGLWLIPTATSVGIPSEQALIQISRVGAVKILA